MPDIREQIEKTGAIVGGGTQQEFGNFLAANFVKFNKIMALTGDKPK
jgi:hypothetical protein